MKRQKNTPLIIAAGICVLCILFMCIALNADRQEVGSFTPPPFAADAQIGTPQVPEDLGWSLLDAKVYRVGICGEVQIRSGGADLWLTNPEGNNVWMKLRVLDAKGTVLAETGLIRPGEYLQWVEFTQTPSPGEKLSLKIMAYEPETYFSAGSVVLNTVAAEGGAQ